MNVSIIGTGYVGLTTGTCFAEMGNEVLCIDVDVDKIERLRRSELTIFEPGLETYFHRNLREGRLRFSTSLEEGVAHGQVLFLALPTPSAADGSADLSYVLDVARKIGGLLAKRNGVCGGYRILVNKSTVPVGTADRLKRVFVEMGIRPGDDVDVVSNPEFLREGAAVDDFMNPERIVVGTSSPRAAAVIRDLYRPFVRQGNPILLMEERSAEMTKYAANAMLATRITLMNEVANVCERIGANVDEVRDALALDSRIGGQFLRPGIGFGGSCFPKDVRALREIACTCNYEFELLDAILTVNRRQQQLLTDRVRARFGGRLDHIKVAIWGLAFKPNTDDVRESPAHSIVEGLLAAGADVSTFDPAAREATRAVFGERISYARTAEDALTGADVLIVCTEWREFREVDRAEMMSRMARPIIFDGRNLYDPKVMARLGFEYHSIGRPHVPPPVGVQHPDLQPTRANGILS